MITIAMINIETKIKDNFSKYATDIGIGVMTLATVVGMMELPDHATNRYILPSQTIRVEPNGPSELNNPLRNEREESAQVYISYGESQRTPSRSGKY